MNCGKSLQKILRQSFWIFGILGLMACTQGGSGFGSLEGAVGGDGVGLANQAGPADRPAVLVEADPVGDCSKYVQYPQDYEPEEVPETCLEAYELMRNPPQIIREPPVILVREEPGVIIREEESTELQMVPRKVDLEAFEANRMRTFQQEFLPNSQQEDSTE